MNMFMVQEGFPHAALRVCFKYFPNKMLSLFAWRKKREFAVCLESMNSWMHCPTRASVKDLAAQPEHQFARSANSNSDNAMKYNFKAVSMISNDVQGILGG